MFLLLSFTVAAEASCAACAFDPLPVPALTLALAVKVLLYLSGAELDSIELWCPEEAC